jgi:hypothetical protein
LVQKRKQIKPTISTGHAKPTSGGIFFHQHSFPGANFFDLVGGENASIVNCNAHARRKFEPIARANKGKGIAKARCVFLKSSIKLSAKQKTID